MFLGILRNIPDIQVYSYSFGNIKGNSRDIPIIRRIYGYIRHIRVFTAEYMFILVFCGYYVHSTE